MSPVLPFDIIALIIDIVGENKKTKLLKKLALVSHSFLQICSKHLFATVDLHDADPSINVASSKNGFVKLLKSRPDVVNYVRKVTYEAHSSTIPNADHLISPILRTIPRLNCLTINALHSDWDALDSSLTSALLHLMHLPTVNHINLISIRNFPLSSLTPSVNLHRLDILGLRCFDQPEEDGSPEIVVQSEMITKIREFSTSHSTLLTTKLLHAKRQDGRPAFNFMDLRRLSMNFIDPDDERNIRYLLQNAKLLEKLCLSVGVLGWDLMELHDTLSPCARTLKVLDLTLSLRDGPVAQPIGGLCRALEAIAGHNMLESLFLEVEIDTFGSPNLI
jgi:hypothetical protein